MKRLRALGVAASVSLLVGTAVAQSTFTTGSNGINKIAPDLDMTLGVGGNGIHTYQNFPYTITGDGQLTGEWAQEGREVDPGLALDSNLRRALLGDTYSLDPNADWTLFLADLEPGNEGTRAKWGPVLTAIPEPSACALMGLAGLIIGMRLSQRRSG
jgi:hypothetical protein